MSRRQRHALVAAAVLLGTLGALGGTYLALTRSANGRRWLLSQAITQINGIFGGRGTLTVGTLQSLGFGRITADNVVLLDTAGVPVVQVVRLEGTVDMRALFDRQIHLTRLALRGVKMDFGADTAGPWNIAYIISGDTTTTTVPSARGFGDDVRIDAIALDEGTISTKAPWAPHPIFTGAARDSVIAVRDSLHDLVRAADGTYFERRVITVQRAVVHDAVIIDPRGRPSSLVLDSLVGAVSDPPVRIVHAGGRLQWTSDSLQFQLADVRLPASSGSATGTVAWNQPGPVRFDVLINAEAGLSDLGWIWDVLPAEGRGKATVRMRTLEDPDNMEFLLSSLDVTSGASRVRGGIAVVVRPADLLLHSVDIMFDPMQSDLLRRVTYDALPPEVEGTFSGRAIAAAGGPLTAFLIDSLDMRFADAREPDAVSRVQMRGTVGIGAEPTARNVTISALRADLRSAPGLVADWPAVDGIITASGRINSASLTAADLRGMNISWTDAVGNTSVVRGDLQGRVGPGAPFVEAALAFDPLSLRALARVDTTLMAQSALRGSLTAQGPLDALQWTATISADESPTTDRQLLLAGTFALADSAWSVTADGTLADVDLRQWLGRRDVPATAIGGKLRIAASAPRSADGAPAPSIDLRAELALTQSATDERPALRVVGSGGVQSGRVVVDSLSADVIGVQIAARGALARDSMTTDTLVISMQTDSLELVRSQLGALANMVQPADSALAASMRAYAADTLQGDLSLSGYLFGNVKDADASMALGARALHVGAIRAGRIFGSARATHVFTLPAFEGAATVDRVEGLGAIRVQTADFRVQRATLDSGQLVFDLSTTDNAHLEVRGLYAITETQKTVSLDSIRLRYDSVAWGNEAPVVVSWDSAALRIAPFALRSNEAGVLAGSAEIPSTGTVRGDVRLDRFPAGEVGALLAGTTPFDGFLTGTAQLAGTRAAPQIEWTLRADSLGVEGVRMPAVRSTGEYANLRVIARAVVTDSAGGMLRAEARVPMDLRLQSVEQRLLSDVVDAEVVVDSLRLQSVELALPGVSGTTGIMNGRLTVRGTTDRPIADGTLTVDGLGADFDAMGVAPREGRMQLRAAADSLVLESFRIRSGGVRDTLEAHGVLRFPAGEPATLNVQISANNFAVARQDDGTDLNVSGNVRVAGALTRPTLSGGLFIPMANIVTDPLGARAALDLTTEAARQLLGADEVPVAESAAQSLAALGRVIRVDNARVDLGNDVWVQTPESKVKLAGGLSVTMSGDQLALEGEITTNRGQYRLDLGVVNRSFSVDSGRVRFYGSAAIAPRLDISATNVVRVSTGGEIPVRVHIGGSYDRPVLTLSSSDPTYANGPESEIISLLIFGAPTFALDGQSQSTVQAVTGVLLPTVGGAVEGVLQQLLPMFNTVQVSTAGGQSQDELNAFSLLDNLSISAGKQLNDRTFLRLNTGVCRGASGQPASPGASLWYGVAVEYRIAQGWTGQVGVDPGSAPCSRLGVDGLPRMQFGFDLFREWIF